MLTESVITVGIQDEYPCAHTEPRGSAGPAGACLALRSRRPVWVSICCSGRQDCSCVAVSKKAIFARMITYRRGHALAGTEYHVHIRIEVGIVVGDDGVIGAGGAEEDK